MHVRTSILAALLFAATLALASDHTCPIDNHSMYFTGNTRVEMGKMLKEYKCAAGHTMWVVQ